VGVAAMSPGPGVGSDRVGIRRVLAFALLGGLLACPVGGSAVELGVRALTSWRVATVLHGRDPVGCGSGGWLVELPSRWAAVRYLSGVDGPAAPFVCGWYFPA